MNKALKTHFNLIDGICGDLTFEEGGNPVTRNMLLAGPDPVLLDSYCAGLIGCRADEVEYLRLEAEQGVGRMFGPDAEIAELNGDNKPVIVQTDGSVVRRLAEHITEDKACSACYSALIYALHKTGGKPSQKIKVGQGFRGRDGGLGCGSCTAGFERFVPGC